MGAVVTWQDGGVALIVAAAVAYVVRKFLLPPKPAAKPVAFISLQQLKSKSKTKPDRG
jgi:hypothetical protein